MSVNPVSVSGRLQGHAVAHARISPRKKERSLLRISVLVAAMVLIMQAPESLQSLYGYKDYIVALLLSLLIKPWLTNQIDRGSTRRPLRRSRPLLAPIAAGARRSRCGRGQNRRRNASSPPPSAAGRSPQNRIDAPLSAAARDNTRGPRRIRDCLARPAPPFLPPSGAAGSVDRPLPHRPD